MSADFPPPVMQRFGWTVHVNVIAVISNVITATHPALMLVSAVPSFVPPRFDNRQSVLKRQKISVLARKNGVKTYTNLENYEDNNDL